MFPHTPSATSPANVSHTALATRFEQVRAASEELTAPLSSEDASLQSMSDASPAKWHLAHTSWFFETFILEHFEPAFKPFNPAYRVLFNSYYNAVGDRHLRSERGLISRPSLDEVLAYRHHVTTRIENLLRELDASDPEFVALMWLGCNHEEQHQELILTDVKHLLSKNPLKPAYQNRWPLTPIQGRKPRWVVYPGGLVEIGRDANHNTAEFAFDNEGPRHKVFLEPFELAAYPVTHGDFAAFIAAGGYARSEFWLSMGWDWVQANRIAAPLYWEVRENQWHTFTLHGMVPIDAHTPICHINYFEADAFARWAQASGQSQWKGARLPREAEWEHAACTAEIEGNFLGSRALHPLALRDEKISPHPAQLFGDVWEWTQSAYLPYPRFQVAKGAVGEYNGKFMCNQFVLRGGSCATPQQHIRATYRNFFPPEARWQFSGLRLARDAG